jgi:D-xylose transport system permease protein
MTSNLDQTGRRTGATMGQLSQGSTSSPSPLPEEGALSAWLRQQVVRLRAGDVGQLPVVAGLLVLAVIFQALNGAFLTPGNLVNLLVQGAVFMLLAMGMVFVLLIAEVDLSVGFVSGVAGVICARLLLDNTSWWVASLAAILVATAIGALHGLIITLLNLPSFVVTLAGLLGWNGVMLIILGNGGTIPINDDKVNAIANGLMSPAQGWGLGVVVILGYALSQLLRVRRRRRRLLELEPTAVTWLRVGALAAAVLVVVWICNANRGLLIPISGVPWVLVIVLACVVLWTFVLERTRFGLYVRAVGGNAEGTRRAGVSVVRIKILVFSIAGFMSGVAGLVYASRLRSVSTNLQGGTLVLYCIAAAVIGGTSLFGGRGKAIYAVLGGLVIAGIDNGMGLLGLSAAAKFVVTGLVLLLAVSIDAVARRGRAVAGVS